MPELPEVESMRRFLAPLVEGRTVTGFTTDSPKAIRTPDAERFAAGILREKFAPIERRGKYFLFRLETGRTLVIHLRMTGHLNVEGARETPERYTHHTFALDDGTELRMRDARKLGQLWLVDDDAEAMGDMGPEPLDAAFTPDVLAASLEKRSAPVKPVLMEQAVVAGVGNIYADEALFVAGIHPLTPARELTQDQTAALQSAIVSVLSHAADSQTEYLRQKRTTPEWQGTAPHFIVPREAGKPCANCGNPVARIAIRGRGTYFCSACQK